MKFAVLVFFFVALVAVASAQRSLMNVAYNCLVNTYTNYRAVTLGELANWTLRGLINTLVRLDHGLYRLQLL
ncbi:unnamed protein product [Nezara viridula]|uniref:Neuropeptide n=1 Tax=Nezara viridula TaxID=85310 RepID=A0A9P0MTM2_NEZVI|nr:unnamed protein product [Nezara viridula]